MNIWTTFLQWLDARRLRSRQNPPFPGSVRLSLRRFEERRVLSVAAAVVHGVLEVHVTQPTQVVNLNVDHSGHLSVNGSIGGNSNSHLAFDQANIASIQITSDGSPHQSIVIDGSQALQLSGHITVDGRFASLLVESPVHTGGAISLSANEIALSNDANLLSLGGGITLDAGSGISIEGGAAIHASHQQIQLQSEGDITIASASMIQDQGGAVIVNGGPNGDLSLSGAIDVSNLDAGQVGGTVELLGHQINLNSGGRLIADGDAGGGDILVGEDSQHGAGGQPQRVGRVGCFGGHH